MNINDSDLETIKNALRIAEDECHKDAASCFERGAFTEGEAFTQSAEAYETLRKRLEAKDEQQNPELVARMVASKLDLDELVHTDFSEQAANVNNEGREAQAEYVLAQWGEEAVHHFLLAC